MTTTKSSEEVYTDVEKTVTDLLQQIGLQNQDNFHDLMKAMVDAIEFTENLHLNVIMSVISTSLMNAKELQSNEDTREAGDRVAQATRDLKDNCLRDVCDNLDKRLKNALPQLGLESVWEKSHNEKVADDILSMLNEGEAKPN